MRRYFHLLYQNLRKIDRVSDYCDECHSLERDLLTPKSEVQNMNIDKYKKNYKYICRQQK